MDQGLTLSHRDKQVATERAIAPGAVTAPNGTAVCGALCTRTRRLNQRQQQVLRLIGKGLTNSEIGHALGICSRTVKAYVSQLFLIYNVSNRTELVGLFAQDSLE